MSAAKKPLMCMQQLRDKYLAKYGKVFPYAVVGDLNGCAKKSRFRHDQCGYEWETSAHKILNGGRGCPRCAGVEKYRNSDEWIQGFERKTLSKFEFVFLEPYTRAKAPTLMRHSACGYEWKVAPCNLLSGKGCPRCRKSEKYSAFSEWLEAYERKYGHKCPYTPDGDFHGGAVSVRFSHEECGYTWMAQPKNILSGKGCPRCAKKERYETFEQFKNSLKRRDPKSNIDDFELIGEMRGVNKKVLLRHNCGFEFLGMLANLSGSQGCRRCSKKEVYSDRDHWMEVFVLRNPKTEIVMTGDYHGSYVKAEFQCKKGHSWLSVPSSVMGGTGCPRCAGKGFASNKPGTLYYLKIFDSQLKQNVFKVGITNRDVESRFKGMSQGVDFLEWKYRDGQEARDKENEILTKHAAHRISSYCFGKGNGHTEWFNRDVLGVF